MKIDLVGSSSPATLPHASTIEPKPGWRLIDFGEIWRYRELFYFLVWRDIKGRYAQSVMGIGWAVVQPFFTMIVFTVVFGNLAKISSDDVPYAIFSYTALVPWTFFSGALTRASGSLTSAAGMITKVYFPRLIIPMAPILGKLVDFAIAMVLVVGLMAWFRVPPTIWVLFIPILILLMMLVTAGLGMWLTPLAAQYRDVSYGMGFLVQLLMFASPVVYPTSLIPDQYQLLYGINPMVGVIEGFRSALLGTIPMPWDLIGVGSGSAILVAFTGALYFRRKERFFADVV